MKLDEFEIIRILKNTGFIKSENDIAELKVDDGNIFIKLNDSMKIAEITMEVE